MDTDNYVGQEQGSCPVQIANREHSVGYSGGLGAGKGWGKLFFLLSPDELQTILASLGVWLVANNRRVPGDYAHTDLQEYIESYSAFTDALAGKREVDWQITGPLYMGITRSLDIVSFTPAGQAYKVVEFAEPVVSMRPFHVVLYNGTVSTSIHDKDKYSLGLEVSYPKVVFFERDGYDIPHDASRYPNYELLVALRTEIHGVTRPCRISSPGRVHRTRIRISESMRVIVKNHPGLAEQGLRVL
jgi:hypothetical protein